MLPTKSKTGLTDPVELDIRQSLTGLRSRLLIYLSKYVTWQQTLFWLVNWWVTFPKQTIKKTSFSNDKGSRSSLSECRYLFVFLLLFCVCYTLLLVKTYLCFFAFSENVQGFLPSFFNTLTRRDVAMPVLFRRKGTFHNMLTKEKE